MNYTVGEVAKKLNIAASTIRYYEKEGLLPFIERSNSGKRIFKENDVSWLQMIECLKKTGMPIKEIRKFTNYCIEGDSRINERLTLINRQREVMINQLKEMQTMFDMLDYKSWYYETAKQAGTCAIHDNIPKENVPKKFHKYLNHGE